MTREGFIRRLQSGRSVHFTYEKEGLQGLVSAWRYGSDFVLTWEECPRGAVMDESLYTRDERHTFETADLVLGFIEEQGLRPEEFRP